MTRRNSSDIEEILSDERDEALAEVERLEAKVARLESFFTHNAQSRLASYYKVETTIVAPQLIPGDIVTWTGAFAVYEVETLPVEEPVVSTDLPRRYTYDVRVLSSSRKHTIKARLQADAEVSVLLQAPLPPGWEWVDTGEPRAYGVRTPEGAHWGSTSRSTLFQEVWTSRSVTRRASEAVVDTLLGKS